MRKSLELQRSWVRALVRDLLMCAGGALVLLWPALLNGGPFWFPDTSNYIRAADGAVVYATGHRSEWSDRLVDGGPAYVDNPSASQKATEGGGQLRPSRPVYSGRSIYYGFLLYIPMIVAGVWGAVLLQALAVSGSLIYAGRIVLREFRLANSSNAVAAFAILVFATPLPFYTSMLMPDVYSGILMLNLAIILSFFSKLSKFERWTLIASSAGIATFHTTHLLAVLALGAIGLLAGLFKASRLPAIAALIPVILVGVGSILLFNVAVASALDQKPFSPPFLTARLTAAGPGTAYLNRRCESPSAPFTVCAYRGRLPVDSDEFLWSTDLKRGVFQLAPPNDQFALAAQDKSFFLATLADDPLSFALAAVRSSGAQLIAFDLKNFNYPEHRVEGVPQQYPPRIAKQIIATRAAQRTMPVTFFVGLSMISAIAGLLVLLARASRLASTGATSAKEDLGYFLLLIILGVILNAAICGTLSGPHARYQMRLIWLIPFAGMLVADLIARVSKKGG